MVDGGGSGGGPVGPGSGDDRPPLPPPPVMLPPPPVVPPPPMVVPLPPVAPGAGGSPLTAPRMAVGCTVGLVVFVLLTAVLFLQSCTPREDQARRLVRNVVAELNRGSCDVAPKEVDPGEWAPACATLLEALDGGTPLVAGPIRTGSPGEIGYSYYTDATFTDRTGALRTISLGYGGDGFFANRPKLDEVSLDSRPVYRRGYGVPTTTTRP